MRATLTLARVSPVLPLIPICTLNAFSMFDKYNSEAKKMKTHHFARNVRRERTADRCVRLRTHIGQLLEGTLSLFLSVPASIHVFEQVIVRLYSPNETRERQLSLRFHPRHIGHQLPKLQIDSRALGFMGARIKRVNSLAARR